MLLCICGKDYLDVLEVQAKKYFSAILNKNAPTIEDDFIDHELSRILHGRFDRLLPHVTALHTLNRMKLVAPSSSAVAAAEEELKKKVAELGTTDPSGVIILSPEASLKQELPSFDPSSIYLSSLLTSHSFPVSPAREQSSALTFLFTAPPDFPFSLTRIPSFLKFCCRPRRQWLSPFVSSKVGPAGERTGWPPPGLSLFLHFPSLSYSHSHRGRVERN